MIGKTSLPKRALIKPSVEGKVQLKLRVVSCKENRPDLIFGLTGENFEESKTVWLGKLKADWCVNFKTGNKCNNEEWCPFINYEDKN